MKIRYVSGFSGDRVDVTMCGETKSYAFGRNASFNRANSSDDKPYIGDILRDLVEYAPKEEQEIEYSAYYLFNGAEYVGDRAERIVFDKMLSEV